MFVSFVAFCTNCRSFLSSRPSVKTLAMHPLYAKADQLSGKLIGAAIEVHRQKGAGLIESIYERCLLQELELRSTTATTQKLVRVEYKGLIFDEPLRFDLLVEDCLLDIPIGLLINFHETVLKNGIFRMILPGANQTEGSDRPKVSL